MDENVKKNVIIGCVSLLLLYIIYKVVTSGKETNAKCPECPKPTQPTPQPNLPNLLYSVPGFLSITASVPTLLLKKDCNDTRKIIFTEAMSGGVWWNQFGETSRPPASSLGEVPIRLKPICSNVMYQNWTALALENAPVLKYTPEQTDWLFFGKSGNTNILLKFALVSVVLKNGSVYAYVKDGRHNGDYTNTRLDVASNIYTLYKNGSTIAKLIDTNVLDGYGIRNANFFVYNKIRPVVDDLGYTDEPRGWFDIAGNGEAVHYCRDVDSGVNRYYSCQSDSNVRYSPRGMYKISNLPGDRTYNSDVIDLDKKYKFSIY